MITMVDKQTIIHLYRSRGLSKRAIARELDISRKTVHKVTRSMRVHCLLILLQ